jgi:hypothetical protein
VAQSKRNAGRGDGGLTTAEREELNLHGRRENRQLWLEREILSRAAAWFAREGLACWPYLAFWLSPGRPSATSCTACGRGVNRPPPSGPQAAVRGAA